MKLVLTRTMGVTRKLVYDVCGNIRIIGRNVVSPMPGASWRRPVTKRSRRSLNLASQFLRAFF
ncbi:MAG TPA: hypothetical protein HPP66_14550 [Planctomycetes bacterium]|nr:hypothetical protein [Planctomycetota bacterium]